MEVFLCPTACYGGHCPSPSECSWRSRKVRSANKRASGGSDSADGSAACGWPLSATASSCLRLMRAVIGSSATDCLRSVRCGVALTVFAALMTLIRLARPDVVWPFSFAEFCSDADSFALSWSPRLVSSDRYQSLGLSQISLT